MSAAVNPTQSAFVLDRTTDVERTSNGATISVVYKGPNDAATKAAFYAALAWGTPHSVYTESVLSTTNEKALGGSGSASGMVEITLTYKPESSSMSGVLGVMRPGESSLESDSNAVEQPIEKLPPNAAAQPITQADWITDLPARKLDALAGIEGWIDPQPTVTRTDAVESSSFTFTEAEIIDSVGQVLSSGSMGSWGVNSASSGKWLFTNKRIVKNGETVTISRTAQYNREGWETSYVYIDEANSTPENP